MKTLLALAVVAGIAAVAAPADAVTAPRLVIWDTTPLVVRGVGFDRSAPVRVSVTYGLQRTSRVVRSTAAGSFTFRWTKGVGGCTILRVAAASPHRHATAGWTPAQDCGAIRVEP